MEKECPMCINCFFSLTINSARATYPIVLCKRYPNLVVEGPPEIRPEDWCGEWRSKEKEGE